MNPCPLPNPTPFSQASPKDWPVISLSQMMNQVVQVLLVDDAGNPTVLQADATANAGVDEQTTDAAVPAPAVTLPITDGSSVDRARIWMKQHPADVEIVEVLGDYKGNGVFQFDFTEANTSKPGLFIGDIQLLDADDNVIFLRRCYIEVEQNTLDLGNHYQPLTISDVRLALRDYPDCNELLDDYEFSAREIMDCIREPVDYWNEALPPVSPFTVSNFPFRQHWLNAVIACLLRRIARWYDRNRLQYSAAGVSVDDRNKGPVYKADAQQMWQEYTQWVTQKKVAINIDNGFSFLAGQWSD